MLLDLWVVNSWFVNIQIDPVIPFPRRTIWRLIRRLKSPSIVGTPHSPSTCSLPPAPHWSQPTNQSHPDTCSSVFLKPPFPSSLPPPSLSPSQLFLECLLVQLLHIIGWFKGQCQFCNSLAPDFFSWILYFWVNYCYLLCSLPLICSIMFIFVILTFIMIISIQ